MRFSLRTLMVVMLLGGPVSAGGWKTWQIWEAHQARAEHRAAREEQRQKDIAVVESLFIPTDPKPQELQERIRGLNADQLGHIVRPRVPWRGANP